MKVRGYKCLKFQAHESWVTSMVCYKDLLISGSYDNTIKVWDMFDSYKCIRTIMAHECIVRCLLILPGGFLASGSFDNKIKLWDLKDFNCLNELNCHESGILALIALKDKRLVSDSYDKTVLWNY
jgi:WD40 repeat protein